LSEEKIAVYCEQYTEHINTTCAQNTQFLVLQEVVHVVNQRFSNFFFKWGPLSLVRMFYGPPYSCDYQTH